MDSEYRWGMRRADVEDWRAFWSEVWTERRADGIARRGERVAERLQDPPELPQWLADVLEECGEEFTPRQLEALVYRYGYGLTLREAANALGTPKDSFRSRLRGAQVKLDHLTGARAAQAQTLREEFAWVLDDPDQDLTAHLLAERQRRWEKTVDRVWGLEGAKRE